MNVHIFDHIASEKTTEVMRSIELFLAIAVVASLIGLVCLAAV